jgi:hypothetical protein
VINISHLDGQVRFFNGLEKLMKVLSVLVIMFAVFLASAGEPKVKQAPPVIPEAPIGVTWIIVDSDPVSPNAPVPKQMESNCPNGKCLSASSTQQYQWRPIRSLLFGR